MAVGEGIPRAHVTASRRKLETTSVDKSYDGDLLEADTTQYDDEIEDASCVLPILETDSSSHHEELDEEVVEDVDDEMVEDVDDDFDDEVPCPVPGFLPMEEVSPLLGPFQKLELDKFTTDETLLIFDWDDTLLPSAWVQTNQLRLDAGYQVSACHRKELSEVASMAAETLRIAKQLGTVVLITNAERGWIELSCQKFMPMLYPCLESIRILSARTMYERSGSSPFDWKQQAFKAEITRFFGLNDVLDSNARKNVLSLGDSLHEREALHWATSQIHNCVSKSVKFLERPGIEALKRQHTLVSSQLQAIVHHGGPLDMHIHL